VEAKWQPSTTFGLVHLGDTLFESLTGDRPKSGFLFTFPALRDIPLAVPTVQEGVHTYASFQTHS
jgi:hypothetical protein